MAALLEPSVICLKKMLTGTHTGEVEMDKEAAIQEFSGLMDEYRKKTSRGDVPRVMTDVQEWLVEGKFKNTRRWVRLTPGNGSHNPGALSQPPHGAHVIVI
jgi:hypothetical protein